MFRTNVTVKKSRQENVQHLQKRCKYKNRNVPKHMKMKRSLHQRQETHSAFTKSAAWMKHCFIVASFFLSCFWALWRCCVSNLKNTQLYDQVIAGFYSCVQRRWPADLSAGCGCVCVCVWVSSAYSGGPSFVFILINIMLTGEDLCPHSYFSRSFIVQ